MELPFNEAPKVKMLLLRFHILIATHSHFDFRFCNYGRHSTPASIVIRETKLQQRAAASDALWHQLTSVSALLAGVLQTSCNALDADDHRICEVTMI